ncbi:MAG TPA: hypothetical protein VNV15_09035 [Opitutaceae bacterium]|jgi:hypothetical protein|nr:hypothetical protein [Opitutaceae bacterium]
MAEVMLSMIILSFAALALVRLNNVITLAAEDNIHQNTAIVMAQGYLEQIKALSFQTLQSIADDVSSTGAPLNTVQINLTNHAGTTITTLFNSGTPYSETFMLDQDNAGNGIYPMTFQFQPVLTDLGKVAGAPLASGVEITVYFKATYSFGVTRTFTSSLRTVRANVRH